MAVNDLDITIVDQLIQQYGGKVHKIAWANLMNSLLKKKKFPCMLASCKNSADHRYCDHHFDQIRQIWIKEGE